MIDTHAHINLDDYDSDRDLVLQRAKEEGVSKVIIPGIDINTSKTALSLAKKHKGFLLALIVMSPKLISSIIKSFFYLVIFDKEKRNIYYCRLSGILNSILGKKSWYRPVLD